MKNICSLLAIGLCVLISTGCNQSSSSQKIQNPQLSPSSLERLSNRYTSTAVACYDYFSHVPTTSSDLISGHDTISLKGDQLTSITTSNNCTVKITAKIIFNKDRSTVDMTNRMVTEATNNECDLLVSLGSSPAHTIVPVSYTSTYKVGDVLPDVLNNYYTEIGSDIAYFAYYYRNNLNLQDACFVVYKAQP